MSKVFLKVYGCKVNQYEMQVMREGLLRKGYGIVSRLEEADYLVVNTCTVTEGSDKELAYFIRRSKRVNPEIRVLLAGCYATNYHRELQSNELVEGTIDDENKYRIPELIKKFEENGREVFSNELNVDIGNEYYGISEFSGRTRAFVKVQDGCNKQCSFCIVTVVRGASRSRNADEIVIEARKLAEANYQEIVLTGVQVGAYGRDYQERGALPELINRLSDIREIRRIRLSSIDPLYVDRKLLECMKQNQKFCNHLHISLQSGDDKILKRMRRGHTAEQFSDLVGMFQREIPDFVLSTDMILGFPGETEEAFQNSLSLIKKMRPMKVHAFPYSDRKGTTAYDIPEKVAHEVKRDRVRKIMALSEECFRVIASAFVEREEEILVEKMIEREDSHFFALGKMANYLPVMLASSSRLEEGFCSVKIKGMNKRELLAKVA